MGSGAPKLIFVAAFILNCLLWSQSRYTQISSGLPSRSHIAKRSSFETTTTLYANNSLLAGFKEQDGCTPLTLPVEQQCAHTRELCPETRTFMSIPYLQSYFCTKPSIRPLTFTGYLLWLVFLFSTLGISASDFFCPNLATLAQLLGLDENVAGVTFLAFGNGSPDVFSTFSAMRANSGGLAIGELLGAASFVTSCVVGTMCIIKPFRVNRYPFLRDVGFFAVAIVMMLVVLWDETLQAWEAASLVLLYLFYVMVVIVGSWWERRQEAKRRYEALLRDEYREETTSYHDEETYSDYLTPTPLAESIPSLRVPQYNRTRAVSDTGPPPRLDIRTELPPRAHSRSPSPSPTPHPSHMPSFSLIGALEFRRVVSSLQQQASSSSLSVFDTPVTPFPGGHYHQHSYSRRHSRSLSRTPITLDDRDPWDAALGVPLNDRSPRASSPVVVEEPHDIPIPFISISHTPGSPASDGDTESQHYIPLTRRQRVWRTIAHIGHVLFPTLHNFRQKTFIGKIAAVFAAPAVMALTLTLPVVVTAYDIGGESKEKLFGDQSRLIDFEEEGVERALIAEEEMQEEMHDMKFNKWLMAVQCALGPLWCIVVLFDGTEHEPWLLLAAGVAGAAIGLLVAVFADKGDHASTQLARCIMGFLVSIVWIMAIADEVVHVLQALGYIFGLSDAIIGLTVFAVGNSLADLVANMSVAVFAPIMGFSACFGGPMLNILLGVGISGSYIIRQTAQPYHLHFSGTLVISSTGLLLLLLATLIFVPWNNYFLPRKWGFVLIFAYVCLMVANVVVEVTM